MPGVDVPRKDPKKQVAATRAWRLANPESRRRHNASYYRALRADPERYSKYLAHRRTYMRARKKAMRARTTWECETPGERPDTKRPITLEPSEVNRFLGALDQMAQFVQDNQEKWGLDSAAAENLVNTIDHLADDIESATYGEKSLRVRKQSLMFQDAALVEDVEVNTKAGLHDPARLLKSKLCVALARLMLGDKPTPEDIEDQAFALMYVPDAELIAMQRRLAGE